MSEQSINLSKGLPETVLPEPDLDWVHELELARAEPLEERRAAVALVAMDHPRYLDAWADLVDLARDEVEAYAYARTGYHRGLDTLRGAGWHGTGYVRWRHESNRGFLRCLDALRRCAQEIGELDEADRCMIFLHQLDPSWDAS
jgi:hypothetical protein